MNELYKSLDEWFEKDERIALATVVKTWGSSPRSLGAKMAVNSRGDMVGSVSGGCIEGAVIQECLEVLKEGGSKLVHYGISDDEAWNVGLACGGEIDVFIQCLEFDLYRKIEEGIKQRRHVTIVTVIAGPKKLIGTEIMVVEGNVSDKLAHRRDDLLTQIALQALEEKKIKWEHITYNNDLQKYYGSTQNFEKKDLDIFIDIIQPKPTLVIIGGVHIAVFLAELSKILGFYTIIIDPRRKFANQKRFPGVDQIINAWPQNAFDIVELDRSTAIAVLTHDPKIDDPALLIGLNNPVFYIGALGSKNTQEERRKRMVAAGCNENQVKRIRGPIGLDLGSKSPEEIALGIMAEIIQIKNAT